MPGERDGQVDGAIRQMIANDIKKCGKPQVCVGGGVRWPSVATSIMNRYPPSSNKHLKS